MKVLFEKENLSEEKSQEIFNLFITDDYSLLENGSSKNIDYAIFSNKETLLKIETKFSKETDLNYLRIIDLEKNNIEEEILEFEVLSSKKIQNLKLSYNQVITIIEALNKYKEFISTIKKDTDIGRLRTEMEMEKTDIIFNYLQDIMNYNYHEACINCLNKYLIPKKNNVMGLGDSGFEQSARKKKVQ